MKRSWKALCLAVLIGSLGCATDSATPPAPSDSPSDAEMTTEAAAEDTGAVLAPPKGKFVQANQKLATLKAKFVYGGKPPARKPVDSSRDPFCAPIEILTDSMLVSKDGGLQNLVLILDAKKTKADLPAEQMKVPEETVQLDNNGCVFKPHIIFVRPGQTIEVLNSDQTGHNANFSFFRNEARNFLIPAGQKKEFKLEAEESATLIPVECNIHPWMKAYVIAQEHPYVGISGDNGEMEIKNLPVGEVTFYVRHENSDGLIDEVMVGGKKEKWSRGKIELDLKAGVNDLGTITIAADKFKN